MRAPFNREIDFYYGPTSPYGPPNTLYRSAVRARVVLQTRIFWGDFPFSLSDGAWVTFPPPLPHSVVFGFVSAGVISLDFDSFDRVALVSGGIPTHYVCWPQTVNPQVGAQYCRAYLAPLPVPF